mmetsp:Transcript_138338/g.275742  ORF Transcript_138338/g.275742 Transcript_138338/m.275742 type:complete len:198 (+) Transcript_138338:606-1199(+)
MDMPPANAATAATAAVPAAAPEKPPDGHNCISHAATIEIMPGQQTRQSLPPLPLPEVPPSPAASLAAAVPKGSPQAWQLLFTPTSELSPAGPQFHVGQQPLLPLPEAPPLPSTGSANSCCIVTVPTPVLQPQQKYQQHSGRDRCRKSLSRVADRVASAALSGLVAADLDGNKAPLPHERPVMLAEQLKAEVRRRSIA